MADLASIIAKMNKNKKEEDKIELLGETEVIRTTTSTGSPYLDMLTGGGFMNGGYNTIVATGGVGKSSMALLASKDCIERRGKIAVYFDGEFTLNESYFKRMNVPKDMFLHRKVRNLETMLQEAEMFAQADDVGLIIFDSIPIFVASKVEAKVAGEKTIGTEAGILTARMPVLEGYATTRDICLLGLTSYKLNPNQMGDPRVFPRGEWQKTMNNTLIDMTKKEIILDEDKNIIGHEVEVRIKKSKNSAYDPKEVYKVNFYLDGGFNKIEEYARILVETGIVNQGGAWITYPSIDGEELKVNGMKAFMETLKTDTKLFEFLKEQIV